MGKAIDFEKDAPGAQPLTNEKMEELTKLTESLKDAREEIAELEADLKTAKEDEREFAEVKIPNLMQEIGITEIVLQSGGRVTLKEDLKCSVTKGNKATVIAFIKKEGDAGIIKNQVFVIFGKGEDQSADQCFKSLTSNGYENIGREETVNTGTFKSMIKELIEEGVEVPFKELGIFKYRTTIIKG